MFIFKTDGNKNFLKIKGKYTYIFSDYSQIKSFKKVESSLFKKNENFKEISFGDFKKYLEDAIKRFSSPYFINLCIKNGMSKKELESEELEYKKLLKQSTQEYALYSRKVVK